MLKTRVMPCLLLRNRGLVKTVGFQNPAYVGDPSNTVRIYNEKMVDELVVLDITAGPKGAGPQLSLIREIAEECFMPLAYGGGVRSMEDIEALFRIGVEKVSLNSAISDRPELLRRASDRFGSQSIIASIDVKKGFWGAYSVYTHNGTRKTGIDPVQYARDVEAGGAGEILLTSIDRDGRMNGFDLELIKSVAGAVGIPVIACGGAGSVADLGRAVHEGGANAVAAGSLFVYQNTNRSVLINFPSRAELRALFPVAPRS